MSSVLHTGGNQWPLGLHGDKRRNTIPELDRITLSMLECSMAGMPVTQGDFRGK